MYSEHVFLRMKLWGDVEGSRKFTIIISFCAGIVENQNKKKSSVHLKRGPIRGQLETHMDLGCELFEFAKITLRHRSRRFPSVEKKKSHNS